MTKGIAKTKPEDTPAIPTELPQKMSEGDKQMAVFATLSNQLDFVRTRSNQVYARPSGLGAPYQLLSQSDLQSLARDVYLSLFVSGDVDKIKKAAEAIRVFINKEIEMVTNDIVQITPGLYWDGELGELTTQSVSGEKLCFHKLFDTHYPTKHTTKVDLAKHTTLIKGYYEDTLTFLQTHTPDELPMTDFPFIAIWANHSQDVYIDLLRSIAYCFLRNKPLGSYILIGERRNGKSSFIGLLHTIFGDQNTSMIRLSQLGDAHYSHQLLSTMLNAPDEEDDKIISAQADFKTLADHGAMTIPVMRSNEPVTLRADFMCFYPMNHMPEWHGSGAGACFKRSLVIPFYADLSQYDNTDDNFAERTFTPTTMAKLMGVVFALANYYTNHPLEFSQTMLREQHTLEEEQDSAFEYRDQFLKYFDGFSNKTELYQDYVNWCKTLDKKISTKKEFTFLWRRYMTERTSVRIGNQVFKVYRIPEPNHHVLHPALSLPDLVTSRVSDMWELGLSAVAELAAYEEAYA